jgi:hypothetical protein
MVSSSRGNNPAAVDLPAYYYRDNFLRLCHTVQSQYGDLLNPAELEFLRSYLALGHPAQCLYVRLASRVGPLFRVARLAYPEIGDLQQPLAELADAGLLARLDAVDDEVLAALYTRAELAGAFAARLSLPLTARKEQWLQAVAALHYSSRDLYRLLEGQRGGQVVCPQALDVVEVLQLLFFGNRRQGLTDFVLSDLGVMVYYPYPLDRQHRMFECREAVEEYRLCGELADSHDVLLQEDDGAGLVELAGRILDTTMDHPSTTARWHRLCNRMARTLERRQQPQLAAQLYARSARHPARERRLRLLERAGETTAGLALAAEVLAAPWCEAEREAAGRILPRLQRKSGIKPAPRAADRFEELQLQLPASSSSVELAAAQHLEQQWRGVFYVENALFNTLFGLAFWDQLFAPVPGAFVNPYQTAPLDMYQQGFYERRRDGIDRRLDELAGVDLETELLACYRRFYPCQNRWVNWSMVPETLLVAALQHIPRQHLLLIWRRQLFDPGENRNGFPDLVAFGERRGGGGRGDYCLIEVKGPGDQLQENQKRWLRCFAGQGIPAVVARVTWADA